MSHEPSQVAGVPDDGRVFFAPPFTGLRQWKRSVVLSLFACYGPSVAMALYMTAFVSCDHCKQTAWQFAAAGSGAFLVIATLWGTKFLLDLPGGVALSVVVTLALIYDLLRLSRWGSLFFVAALVLIFVSGVDASILAYATVVTLALIYGLLRLSRWGSLLFVTAITLILVGSVHASFWAYAAIRM